MIEIKDLYKIYNANKNNECRALDGVSLDIQEGELIAVVGKSGSGKSTLLNMIGGFDKPTSGSLCYEGQDIAQYTNKQKAEYRSKCVGSIFQEFMLIEELNALENVKMPLYFAKYSNSERTQKATQLLYGVGLEHKLKENVINLSGGEKQRVAIARALANDPKIILADEPTGALDTSTSKDIIDMLLRINKRGKTIIIVTHEMHIAKLCPRIITLEDGKIKTDCNIV